MARRDTNSRITPDSVQNTQLQPVASPVNKQREYRPDSSDAQKTSQLYEGLAELGSGLMDMNTVLRLQSKDNAIAAHAATQDKNKRDWADMSRNVTGMAKFNPYNKDALRKLVGADIAREYTNKLYADPELKYREPEEVETMRNNLQLEMMTAFKEAKLEQKDYADYLVRFSNQSNQLMKQYVHDHAEVELERTNNQISTTYAGFVNQNGQSGFSLTLGEVVQEGNALGRTTEGNAQNVLNTVRKAVANNPSQFSTAFVLAELKSMTVNGKSMSEIVPDLDAQVQKMMREAKRADYDDKQLEYANHQLDIKIASDSAMKDMYAFYQENPNATLNDYSNYAKELVDQYGLEEVGFTFLKQVANDKTMLTDLEQVESDPAVLQELGAKAALGTLTGEEVNEAIINKQLNWKDGLSFTDRINRQAKAEVQAVEKTYKDFDTKLKDKGIYGSVLKFEKPFLQEIQTKSNQTILDLNNGLITPQEATKRLQDLERIANAKAQVSKIKATNDSFLLNANYIKTQDVPTYTKDAVGAFNSLGLLRGKVGQRVQTDITSRPQQSRTINGQESRHIGYDLGATSETKVHSAPMGGSVIYAGYLSDFGNYVVVKYDNGSYARFGHLSSSTKHLLGKKITPNAFLGYAGSTGRSTGVHLHVDFWDKNRNLISVEKFQKGIR